MLILVKGVSGQANSSVKLRAPGTPQKNRQDQVGHQMNLEIEYVARAFYAAQDDGCCWDSESPILQEEFRALAREALALLAQQEAQSPVSRRQDLASVTLDEESIEIFMAA
jgi:hypothetical protein